MGKYVGQEHMMYLKICTMASTMKPNLLAFRCVEFDWTAHSFVKKARGCWGIG